MSTILTTNTAQTASPNWTAESLDSVDNTPGGAAADFVVDAFSPFLLGTGSTVNGWLCTQTGVARINNIGGTENFTNLNVFGTTTAARQMQSSIKAEGWVIVISYDATNGTRATYTTNGGTTWATVTVSSAVSALLGSIWAGGLWMSDKVAGLAVTTAFKTSSTAAAYVTQDYGATWTEVTSASVVGLIDLDDYPAGVVEAPLNANGQSLIYGATKLTSTYHEPRLKRVVGTTVTDISPVADGKTYGVPYSAPSRRAAFISVKESGRAMLCGESRDGSTGVSTWRVFITSNLWATTPLWTAVTTESSTQVWRGGYFAGDTPHIAYLLGVNGNFGYWNFAAPTTIFDRKGDSNNSTITVGLCGTGTGSIAIPDELVLVPSDDAPGTTVTDLGSGNWQVTGYLRATDRAYGFKDLYGRCINIDSVASTTADFRAFTDCAGSYTFDGADLVPGNYRYFVGTRSTGSPNPTATFHAFPS